ncbi:laccase 17 [Gautieria morchelliformis]|nr:laccase 17 [Gautieria morchelliformis]
MLSVLLSFFLTAGAQGALVYRDWELTAQEISPDGFKRSAELVNGMFPGPVLTANKGDLIQVNVKNRLLDPTMVRSTSIHWHGILQPRNAQNDGASFVTQCPIAQNQSFLYTLLPEQQTGTYWYHSHLKTQYVDGIRGPLVIYDPEDPQRHLYDVDDPSTIVTLADWYHGSALRATSKFSPTFPYSFFAGGPEPNPDSGLINGVGRFTGGPAIPWARINVTYGKRYRLRLLGLSAAGAFEFSIFKHSMTVIEADGIAHQPYVVDSIPILPGQRYSVIVINANQAIDNYWISAKMSDINPGFNGTSPTFAVLHYDTAPDADPTTPQPTGLPAGGIEFQEFNLIPLENPGAPGGDQPADQVFNLTFAPDLVGHPNGDRWVINGIQYKSPSVPTLLNILSSGDSEPRYTPSEHTFTLKPNAIIEVVLFILLGGPGHPFHLHGHAFDVIQSSSGGPNFINPPRRDVVSTSGSTDKPVRIRFRTDNPGPWILHCHIEWHFTAGLAVVFAEDPQGIKKGPKSVHPNEQWEQLCQIYNKLAAELQ